MKQQRLHKRFSANLPVRLFAKTESESKLFNVETKDMSASGAFIYTKEAAFLPDDTRFILFSSNPEKKRIRLKELKQLVNFPATMVRSTTEGIAIRFDRPVELFA
jgi:hypothetical protein